MTLQMIGLHELVQKHWESKTIPPGMRPANTITPYKKKGDRTLSSNYRGISSLSVTGKMISSISSQGYRL